MDGSEKMIVGVGSALIDILVHADHSFLEELGAKKGGMTLVDNAFIEETLRKVKGKPDIVPGGAACNTMVGIGRLGGRARFIGKRGEDSPGIFFEEALKKNRVEPSLLTSPSSGTGRVLSIITPDAQRTMFTFLGASSEMLPQEISEAAFHGAAIVFIEGYLLFNKDLILAALRAGKKSGALIALDLASFTVVEESRAILDEVVRDYVDILIANEDEARAYTGCMDVRKGIEALSRDVDMAVLKIGKKGSYVSHAGKVFAVAPRGDGSALDTTGAGDLWASGFLFGLLHGYPLESCGELGSVCGYEVCQVVGAHIPDEGWERIQRMLDQGVDK